MADLTAPRLDRWYSYDELTDYLRHVESACPELCRLQNLGSSPEGREIWMLEVADFAAGDTGARPAYLSHANIHAKELAGTNSSLKLVWDLLTNSTSAKAEEIDTHALLREVVFYVIPRLNPDGAEFALTTGGEIRSRNEEIREPNCLYQHDVDGDGAIVDMRIERPDGQWKCSPDDPRVMIPRETSDREGTFYAIYPEGLIEDWDGGEFRRCARSHDFNRNWPANWHQEHEQGGAGDFPFSEPEMRALADFVYEHHNIFGILGFHCGSSAILMPPSTGSLEEIAPADLSVFRELGERAAELTGLTLLPTIEYRSADQPPASLKGHSADWGYRHMGLFHFEVEQGNVYNAAGVKTEDFFAAGSDRRSVFLHDAMRYHDAHPEQEMFVDWHEVEHPQLGRVEIGGWKKYWMINPSFETLREWIAPGSARFIIEYATLRPQLQISELVVEAVGEGVHRVRARVTNAGGFPTNISGRGLQLRALKPVAVDLLLPEGAELLSNVRYREIGHLAAHGRSGELEWFVRCEPGEELTVRARSQKAGVAERTARC
ncbi:MAG: M14 family metallopeptidase [Armatimonadota bacterium]|jgi:murein tripeptide amidase MpaA